MRSTAHILALLILLSFQNCGQQITVDRVARTPRAGAAGDLKVSDSIQPHDDISGSGYDPSIPKEAIVAPRDPLALTHLAQPLAIDFATTAAATDNTTGVWGANRFTYRLVLITGTVYTLDAHQAVYQLTKAELAQVNAMFAGTTLDIAGNFLGFDRACAMVLTSAYASLTTNYGLFDLGTGTSACTSVDVYHSDGSGLVGLKDYFVSLQSQIQTLTQSQASPPLAANSVSM